MTRRGHFRRFARQTYLTKRYANPHTRAPKARAWWLWASVFIAGVFLIAAGIVFLFRAPIFAVNDVVVDGTQSIPAADVQAVAQNYLKIPLLFGGLSRGNRLFFDADELRADLARHFVFESVTVTRDGHAVRIQVKEAVSQFLWHTGAAWFVAGLDGRLIRVVDPRELENRPDEPSIFSALQTIRDMNAKAVAVGEAVMTADEIKNTFAFHERLRAQGIPIVETQIDRQAGKWMAVLTGEGYRILFDAALDIDAQALRLQTVLRDSIKTKKGLQYIDLRFGDHVYLK